MNIKRNVFSKVVIPTGVIAGISVAGIGAYSINHALNTSAQDIDIEERDLSINYGSLMRINPQYEEYLRDVEAGNGDKWELIPNQYIADGVSADMESNMSLDNYVSADNLPLAYSLIDKGLGTTIKNQGVEGDCWAYTISSVIESYLLKNKSVNMEVSAKQLDYLLAPGYGYSEFLTNLGFSQRSLGSGSNIYALTYVLGGNYAPVSDASFFAKMKANDAGLANYTSYRQYQDANMVKRFMGGEVGAYTTAMPVSQVRDESAVNYIPTDFKTYQVSSSNASGIVGEIKSNIFNYGAAFVGSYAPGTTNCWDATTKTIIDLGSTICGSENGHAMTVVGWDDNHAYTNPKTGATGTGAFLLQNSWGSKETFAADGITVDSVWAAYGDAILASGRYTEAQARGLISNYLDSFSDETYIWLAYDIASSDSMNFASITNIADNTWDHIYDASNITASLNGNANQNIVRYTAGENETLTAVGVQTIAAMAQYDITYTVSVDPTGSGSALRTVGSVTIPAGVAGEKMITLTDSVNLSGNFLVSIALTITSNGETGTLNLMSQGADLRNYVIPVAYTMNGNTGTVDPTDPSEPGEDQPTNGGETDGEGEREDNGINSTPDPEPTPEPAPEPEAPTAPNTGSMTDDGKQVIVSSTLVGLVSAVVVARIVYVASRKHTVKLRK